MDSVEVFVDNSAVDRSDGKILKTIPMKLPKVNK